jgi:hypothetical protein
VAIPIEILRKVAHRAYLDLGVSVGVDEITFIDYHGFYVGRFPERYLEEMAELYELDISKLQLELVEVRTDLRREVHCHPIANACVSIVGVEEKVDDPRGASAYIDGEWRDVDITTPDMDIPAGKLHGFTVSDGGVLYFISAQSPPIRSDNGHDDYRKCCGECGEEIEYGDGLHYPSAYCPNGCWASS